MRKLPNNYSSDRYGRSYGDYDRGSSGVQPGISRSNQRGYSGRATSSRGAAPRASGQRPSQERAGSGSRRTPSGGAPRRPSENRRPPSRNGGRRPRRRGSNFGFYAFVAVFAVVLIAVGLLIIKPGRPADIPVNNPVTTLPGATLLPADTAVATEIVQPTAQPGKYANIAEALSEAGHVQGLSEEEMVKVNGLSIKEGLPEQWMNVLLLGTDERSLTDSARTDAIMICSVNTDTGEVKLTSIMRDLAVEFDDIGEYNGTYRINAANYFGGPDLTMKTVNELFDMNIRYYVMVNFFGFGKVAQQLGGVEVDVDEQEMNLINERIVEQYKFAYLNGIMDFDTEQKFLEQYGENIHLNGNQTLAYARIRKTDGGDYKRTTRQQIVLNKLLAKLKKLNALEMTQLLYNNLDMVKTNLEPETILAIATKVVGNGLGDMETFRLPQPNTYKEEVRNEQGMLYDCDFATNALRLYNFIYE